MKRTVGDDIADSVREGDRILLADVVRDGRHGSREAAFDLVDLVTSLDQIPQRHYHLPPTPQRQSQHHHVPYHPARVTNTTCATTQTESPPPPASPTRDRVSTTPCLTTHAESAPPPAPTRRERGSACDSLAIQQRISAYPESQNASANEREATARGTRDRTSGGRVVAGGAQRQGGQGGKASDRERRADGTRPQIIGSPFLGCRQHFLVFNDRACPAVLVDADDVDPGLDPFLVVCSHLRNSKSTRCQAGDVGSTSCTRACRNAHVHARNRAIPQGHTASARSMRNSD